MPSSPKIIVGDCEWTCTIKWDARTGDDVFGLVAARLRATTHNQGSRVKKPVKPVKPHSQSNETAGQAKPPVSYVPEVGV